MTSPAEFRRRFLQSDAEQTSDFQKALDAHRDQAARIRDNAAARIEQIAQRTDMTREARQSAAARVYKPACAQIQDALNQHIKMVKDHKQQLVRKAFGSDKPADPATAMARRQARELASKVTDKREAEDLIRDANFSGDYELARAVAGVAFERGWDECVDVWNADGRNDTAVRHLREVRMMPDTEDALWRINTAASYSMPDAGPDLMGLKDHEISRSAATDYGPGDAA